MARPVVEFDRSLLGVERPLNRVQVTRAMIRQYAQAVGDANPIYTSEEAARRAGHPTVVAPPTFTTVLTSFTTRPNIGLGESGPAVLATWAVQPQAPIYAGDIILCSATLADVYAKTGRSGTMVFVVWGLVYRNQRQETVARARQSFVRKVRPRLGSATDA